MLFLVWCKNKSATFLYIRRRWIRQPPKAGVLVLAGWLSGCCQAAAALAGGIRIRIVVVVVAIRSPIFCSTNHFACDLWETSSKTGVLYSCLWREEVRFIITLIEASIYTYIYFLCFCLWIYLTPTSNRKKYRKCTPIVLVKRYSQLFIFGDRLYLKQLICWDYPI